MELNDEQKVSEIMGHYKDDIIVGYDEEGVYFQVHENYWNVSFSSSEDYDWLNHSNYPNAETSNVTDGSENEGSSINQQEQCTSTEWSDSDNCEHQEPVVPPPKLEEEEIWSEEE